MTDLCNHHLCLSCSTFRNFRFCIALLHRCSSCESYSLICVTITTTLYWYFDFRWLKDNTAVLKYIVRRHKMSFLPLFPHHVFHMWLFYRKPTIIWPFCVRLWHISSYFQLFAIITTDYIHKKKTFCKKASETEISELWNPKTSLQWNKVSQIISSTIWGHQLLQHTFKHANVPKMWPPQQSLPTIHLVTAMRI